MRFIILFVLCLNAYSDSFYYNPINNHGALGVINIPSARFYSAPSASLSFYRGFPDRKVALTLYPYDWLEGTIYYSSIKDRYYGSFTSQDYKDKGFNLKLRLKEQGRFPAIALGLNDIGGTGLYSGEYIVSSLSRGNFDYHFGIAWGSLNHHEHFKNPFIYLNDKFSSRDSEIGKGGTLNLKDFFSGESISVFAGLNYLINENTILKFEYDPTKTPGRVGYEKRKSDFNVGINFLRDKYIFGLNYERDTNVSFNISYREKFIQPDKKYKVHKNLSKDRYQNLIKINRLNNIGISRIQKKNNEVHVDFTQFSHDFKYLDNVTNKSIVDAGFKEVVVKNYKIAGLDVIKNTSNDQDLKEVFKNDYKGINQAFSLKIRPFIAGREDFVKAALLLEHDAEFIISENLFFSTNLKLSLIDNFDDLVLPPVDTYPAQVRSDIKKYLNNIGDGVSVGRAQLEYFKTVSSNNHFLFSLGIYEDMFSGYGFEYLNFRHNRKFNWGYEAHKVHKRDYKFGFGLLGYENITHHLNFYYKNSYLVPFDFKISFGEYLAGDTGTTLDFSRTFKGGVSMGIFASFTDVSFDQFGEGSFDKGIYFKIPLGKKNELVNFEWRPLTKDPASKLIRKNDIYSLVNKFSSVN